MSTFDYSSMSSEDITTLFEKSVKSNDIQEKEELCEYFKWKLTDTLPLLGNELISVRFRQDAFSIAIKNSSTNLHSEFELRLSGRSRNIRDVAEQLFSYTFSLLQLLLTNELLHKNITKWEIKMVDGVVSNVFIIYKGFLLSLTQQQFFTEKYEFNLDAIFLALLKSCRALKRNEYIDAITFDPVPSDDDIVYIRDEPQYQYGKKSITEWYNQSGTSPFTRNHFELDDLIVILRTITLPIEEIPNPCDLPSNRRHDVLDEEEQIIRQQSNAAGIECFRSLSNMRRQQTL